MMSPQLEGTWQMIRAELAGESAPDLVVEGTEVTLTRGGYVVRFSGLIVDRGSLQVGGLLPPQTLVLRGVEGPNAGRTIPCLYQLMGDRLRICYGLDGVQPTEMKTHAGEQRYLATYRRQPPS